MRPAQQLEQKRTTHSAIVRRVVWRDHAKEIHFCDNTPKLRLTRSACVKENDLVEFGEQDVSVVCENGNAQLLPTYIASERLTVGNLDLEFLIKEITDAEELNAYKALTQFHYRTHMLHGRTARLIVRNYHPNIPTNCRLHRTNHTVFYEQSPRSYL